MRQQVFFYSIILVFYTMVITEAKAAGAMVLTLDEAVAQAMTMNRKIRAVDAAIEGANARLTQEKSARLPKISLETLAMRSNAPMTVFGSRLSQQSITAADFAPASLNYPTPITQFQSRIVVDVPLYRGGALSSAIVQADSAQHIQAYDKIETKQRIMYAVIAAYSDALRAQHSREVAVQAVKSATTHVDTAKHMLAKGMLLRSDVMDAEVHQLNATVAITQAENRIDHAKDRLRQLLAMNINTPLTLKPWSGFVQKEEGQNAEVWIKRAWKHRAKLYQLRAQLDVLHAKETQLSAAFKPTVGLQMAQEWNNNTVLPQHGNTTVIAALRWNIFAGGADLAAIRVAEAASAKQVLLLQDVRQSMAVAIKHALRKQSETHSRWQVRQQALAQAKESLRIHTLRFKQGMENINTMLDAQSRVNQAAEAVVDARFDHQMARVGLKLVAGVLNQERLNP